MTFEHIRRSLIRSVHSFTIIPHKFSMGFRYGEREGVATMSRQTKNERRDYESADEKWASRLWVGRRKMSVATMSRQTKNERRDYESADEKWASRLWVGRRKMSVATMSRQTKNERRDYESADEKWASRLRVGRRKMSVATMSRQTIRAYLRLYPEKLRHKRLHALMG